MPERRVVVGSKVGLHARPAATFVQTAAKSGIDVTVAKLGSGQEPVSAKSILAVLALDVRQGDTIVIRAEGEGADDLVNQLAEIATAP